MKIDIYKPVVLFLLPAVLAGCSSEREPFPQGGKAGLRIESCSRSEERPAVAELTEVPPL